MKTRERANRLEAAGQRSSGQKRKRGDSTVEKTEKTKQEVRRRDAKTKREKILKQSERNTTIRDSSPISS